MIAKSKSHVSPKGDFLDLPQWQTMAIRETEFAYEVEAVLLSRPSSCPRWGCFEDQLIALDKQPRRIIDSPVRGKHVYINFTRHRYKCRKCKRTVMQPLVGVNEKRRTTTRLIAYIEIQAFSKHFQLVAEETGKSATAVRNIFSARAVQLTQIVRFETPRHLGLDQVFINGRACFIITDLERHRVIEILDKCDRLTLCRYLLQLPERERIEAVVSNYWMPYIDVARRVLPGATLVLNKWHIVGQFQQTCREVLRKIRVDLPFAQQRVLSIYGKLLHKRIYSLSETDHDVLAGLVQQRTELEMIHRLKCQFLNIWKFKNRQKAEARYDELVVNIPPDLHYAFSNILRIMTTWREEIFNYFDYRITNAYTQSINFKIESLQRAGRGYTFETLRAKLLYADVVKPRRHPPVRVKKRIAGGGSGAPLKRRSRRAPAPRGIVSNTERLRRVRESQNVLNGSIQLPEGWMERFEFHSKKREVD
jgi:transposase